MMGAESLQVERYLTRLGIERRPPPTVEGIGSLMTAHLVAVPFENLDVYWQRGVSVDVEGSVSKIVDAGRGGWCFELNGAFAWLLQQLGFDLRLLGAAVLLGGPNRVIDHMALEVTIQGRPHLVDVGFGDGFTSPLPLNVGGDQVLNGGNDRFGLIPGAEGTTLVRYRDVVPEAQFRFRRVSLAIDDFGPASQRLYADPDGNFRQGPVVSRLLGHGPDRVTLTTDRLRLVRGGRTIDVAVEGGSRAWFDHLRNWFGIDGAALRRPRSG